MRLRHIVLCAVVALAAPGCNLFYSVAKGTGLVSPPKFSARGEIPSDFRLGIEARGVADPPIDYLFAFERSGKTDYTVTVRSPRRREASGTFEVTESQIVGLWKAVVASKFDELAKRYPEAGDGRDTRRGVRVFYVLADGVDHRVESVYQAHPALDALNAAVLDIVPKEVLSARAAAGSGDAPREYLADTATMLFHVPTCPQLKEVPAQRRQPFATWYEAVDFQFKPCPECRPTQTR